MTTEEKVAFLSSMELIVGWTPGTDFEKATIKLEMNCGPNTLDYFLLSEIVELVAYFDKLPTQIALGYQVSVADKFTYNILKTNGIFKAFNALYRELSNE